MVIHPLCAELCFYIILLSFEKNKIRIEILVAAAVRLECFTFSIARGL